MSFIRLDKFICDKLPDATRSRVKLWCRQGRVKLNGKNASPEQKLDPDADEVTLDGERLSGEKFIYIMLNKPQGYVCSTRDGKSPTVLSLVPERFYRKGLFPAGRLDKDTEGFVLITNDGALAHKMLSPKSHVFKTYEVYLRDEVKPDAVKIFEQGAVIDGKDVCKPALLEIDSGDKRRCVLKISEGKFHQVKRMFASLGNEVIKLKRTAIGEMQLDPDLKSGECLEILHKDLSKLLVNIRLRR